MKPLSFTAKIFMVALVFASATILVSCKEAVQTTDVDLETLKTQQSNDLNIIYSVNGKLSYRFETPLMERYELAPQPYMEFRQGVNVITYNDSTHTVESELVADYAKFIEPLELWEAKGNVVAKNAKGQILESQQLFWDQKSDKIYSNVDTKITQGDDVIYGIGFESNSKFDDFIFRQPRGKVAVDTEPMTDSTGVEQPSEITAQQPAAAPQPAQSQPAQSHRVPAKPAPDKMMPETVQRR